MQFSVKGRAGNHQVKVSLTVGLVLDVIMARLPVSYHINILECSWNVSTMRGRSNEVVEVMSRHKVDICGLQEVRWRGASARLVKEKIPDKNCSV